MIDRLKFFYDLAGIFFKAFTYAVQEHPPLTALVFFVAEPIYMERRRNSDQHDPLFAFVIFGVSVRKKLLMSS
jgi:hypothetical protein